jgi:hypothetical protein
MQHAKSACKISINIKGLDEFDKTFEKFKLKKSGTLAKDQQKFG